MNGLRPFELLEDLAGGHTAKAVLLRWNGDKYVRTDETIDVSEFAGARGMRGDRGYGYYSPESRRWEAVGGVSHPTPWAVF